MAKAYKREDGKLAHAPFFHALHADSVARRQLTGNASRGQRRLAR